VIVAIHDEYPEMGSFERARRGQGALERALAGPPLGIARAALVAAVDCGAT
jgi:hypothetical protein